MPGNDAEIVLVQAEMLFDRADALKRVVDLLPAGCISCNVLT